MPGSALRLAGVAAVTGLLTVLGAPAAQAAPALTIPLDPPMVLVAPYPVENFGPLTLAGLQSDTYAPVPVQWGGTVVLELPPSLDGGAIEVTLGLAPTDADPPTVEYSTENSPPDVTVTPGPPGEFSITLPPLVPPHGPVGYLTVDGLAPAPGITGVDVMPAEYLLEFDASYPSSQTLAPALFAVAAAPCAASSGACPERQITAGQSFTLTVPASSSLRQFGLGTFDDVSMTLAPLSGQGAIELAAAAADAASAADTGGEPPLSPMVAALGEASDDASADATVLDVALSGVSAQASTYSATATVGGGGGAGPAGGPGLVGGASGGGS
jgi:hypothetical protein